MPLNEQQVIDLFKSLGRIEARLESGDEKFETIREGLVDSQSTKEGLNLHLERHRNIRWVMGVLWGVIAVVGAWWLEFKGN